MLLTVTLRWFAIGTSRDEDLRLQNIKSLGTDETDNKPASPEAALGPVDTGYPNIGWLRINVCLLSVNRLVLWYVKLSRNISSHRVVFRPAYGDRWVVVVDNPTHSAGWFARCNLIWIPAVFDEPNRQSIFDPSSPWKIFCIFVFEMFALWPSLSEQFS